MYEIPSAVKEISLVLGCAKSLFKFMENNKLIYFKVMSIYKDANEDEAERKE